MPSDAGNIVLGVDLDGVCADFYGRMRGIAAEWFESEIEALTEDVSYGLPEWGVESSDQYSSLHRFAVTQRELFSSVPMIPGARRVLRKLSSEGYRIRIITHRLFIQYFHELAVRQTIEWLDRHGIPYWDLCFMKEKDQVGADIYVEDSPANVESLRTAGHYTICFGNSTNKQVAAPRASTWDDVYAFIKAKAPSPNPSIEATAAGKPAAAPHVER
jgi:5'(3')-deoxyribonucleotidase